MMTKQREKVGQEAFLRAVAKGMESSPKEGGGARVGEPERRPFILNEVRTATATTPDVERNTLDLYQLQRDLQKQPEPFFISQPQSQQTQHTATPPLQQQQPPATPPSSPPPHPAKYNHTN